jgi:ribose 1,5-bisphosphokinase
MAEGRLILVVGPSGAGKDSLIAAAAERLAGNACYHFPKREITRASDAGGEDHIEVSAQDFLIRREAGGYALAWDAHGLSYGIPGAINHLIAGGATVVVNTSRTVIETARDAYPNLRIIFVTAPLDILAHRIAARGRESAEDVAERLARAGIAQPSGPDVITLNNDGSLDQAVTAFLAAIGEENRK